MSERERKEEFKRLLAQVEDEHKRKLEALYTLYPEYKLNHSKGNGLNGSARGMLPRLVRQAMKKHEDRFTLDDMSRWITEIDPAFSENVSRIKLSNTLGRMVRKGKLEKVPDSSPAIYEKRRKAP